ncbi:MAG: DUF6390 family protein [Candidatus Beckwithbacteria bacterium]
MRGLLRCARYAFSPNKLKYCGPGDKNFQLFSYVNEGVEDQGLAELLDDFSGMFPYLKLIADENKISDPFDEKVVEAYWVGNELLEGVRVKDFYKHLVDERDFKERIKKKEWKWIINKVPMGAKVHHSFHVFNIWNRTGHEAKPHTIPTMDNCRISWGKIKEKGKDKLKVETQELIYEDNRLSLKDGVIKEVSWRIGDKELIKGLKKGDLITTHWGWVCEKVRKFEVTNLEYYTKHHLKLANLTI